MIRRLCLLLLLTSAVRAELISVSATAPEWRDLFTALSVEKNRYAAFEEHRTFPSRKRPLILTGEIRVSPARGLSLHYTEPTVQTMIVDPRGVLLRNARGRSRSAPNDARTQELTAGLAQVLRFNLPELERTFTIRGERFADATWSLEFTPRDETLASTLGTLRVDGRHHHPARIAIERPGGQRVEIILRAARDDVAFTDAELKRFFR